MIIEYEDKYQEEVKDLLYELQVYIVSLDKENGKIFLLKIDEKIVGLIAGIILESIDVYDFKAPRRRRITEFIVTKEYQKKDMVKFF